MYQYQLSLETGTAEDDAGAPVAWAACPDLPGAYEEAGAPPAALAQLTSLVRQIIAEHLAREDPLDPAIRLLSSTGDRADNSLIVTITEADLAAARNAAYLMIEVPDP